MDLSDVDGRWDHGSLPANVRIGPGCFLERRDSFARFRSRLDPGLVLGAGVRVHTWTEFAVGPEGYVEVGDRTILVGVAFMCAERITVGRDVRISYQVTIMDSDFHTLEVTKRRADAVANAPDAPSGTVRPAFDARPVTIEDGVWIGIGAIVLKGVTVGAGARIDPGSVVSRDVPAGTTWAGNPARPLEPR